MKKLLVPLIIMFGLMLASCSTALEPGLNEIGNDRFEEVLAESSSNAKFVYIGRPTCPFCREFEPILDDTLRELEIGMYYFQTAAARYENEARLLSLLDPLNITGVPIIVFLEDGLVSDYLIGVSTREEIIDFLTLHDSSILN